MPIPESSDRRPSPRFLLPARAWLIIAAAFAAGLLLSALLWLGRGDESPGAPLAGPAPGGGAAPSRSLPAPQPAETDSASGMAEAEPGASPRPLQVPPAARPPPTTDTGPSAAAPVEAATRAPMAVETPAPRYPTSALRRGESGQVLLRVQVGAEGRVRSVDVVSSSNSRTLDRAAVAAVMRWRFQPALRGGQPVDGTVQVPIDFSPAR